MPRVVRVSADSILGATKATSNIGSVVTAVPTAKSILLLCPSIPVWRERYSEQSAKLRLSPILTHRARGMHFSRG
jgi:hypothetical protein